MEYLSVRETAEKWNISARMVQQFCAQGRVPGARKLGKFWAIPALAEKPQDPRLVHQGGAKIPPPGGVLDHANLMPLMNTPFPPGRCLATVEAMAAGPQRDIARAEYHYFTGEPEAAAAFVAAAGAVLLHLPLPAGLPATGDFLPLLPMGLRAFALYVQAHYLYLKGEYGPSAGIVEGVLAMGAARYPIPAIYLHLVAVMDYMSLKQTDRAKAHLLAAWEIARPDDLIEGFGEHHGLLSGMLEAVLKPAWPEDFKRIIEITYRFSAGWRRVHNPETGHDVADDLTTTEFAVCMLAARDWSNQDIAQHLHISLATVKRHLSSAMKKLGIPQRSQLQQFMLR